MRLSAGKRGLPHSFLFAQSYSHDSRTDRAFGLGIVARSDFRA